MQYFTVTLLLSNCLTWSFPILKAAKHCSRLGRCICQVEQNLEQHFYLKTGIYLFNQVLEVLSKFPKTPQQNLSLSPLTPKFGTFGPVLPTF